MIKTISHKKKNPVKVLIKHKTERIQRDWMKGVFMETARNNTLSYVGNQLKRYGKGTIIDCGSHIGNHSLFFAAVCESQKVYSFEPYKPSYDHSLENFALNDFDQIEAFNIALGAKKQRVSVDKKPEDILNQIDYSGSDVQMLRMDAALKGKEFPGGLRLIKVDVDGSELITLKGAKGILKKHRPDVIIECATGPIFKAVDAFMRLLGYKPVMAGGGQILILNTTNTYIYRYPKHG